MRRETPPGNKSGHKPIPLAVFFFDKTPHNCEIVAHLQTVNQSNQPEYERG